METMKWTKLISSKRFGQEERHKLISDDRSEFRRDYDRLIFSAPFRRLQNKTQVFPLPGSVFVHNRLTHSLEVSSVGRSLGHDCANRLIERHPELAGTSIQEIGTIVSTACLAHDMGNPPFGHSGEKAISTYFSEGKGLRFKPQLTNEEWFDLTHFEGNANVFRLLTHQFKGRRPGGFVMTYSTLASVVKYPFSSGFAGPHGKFGFFCTESEDYRKIADELGIICKNTDGNAGLYARHPLVYLVEAADDICYEIMDIEDAFKLKLLTNAETKELLFSFLDANTVESIKETFSVVTDINEQIVYLRACVINCLEHECVDVFINNEKAILNGTFEGSLIDHISEKPRQAYAQCKKTAVNKIYRSKDVVDIELAGYRIISTLMDTLIDAVSTPDKTYSKLIINRVSSQYEIDSPTLYGRIQAVLDCISGMTDVYALDLYRKLNGMSLPIV